MIDAGRLKAPGTDKPGEPAGIDPGDADQAVRSEPGIEGLEGPGSWTTR